MKRKQPVSWDQRWDQKWRNLHSNTKNMLMSLYKLGGSPLTCCCSSSAEGSIPSSQSISEGCVHKCSWNSYTYQAHMWINSNKLLKTACQVTTLPFSFCINIALMTGASHQNPKWFMSLKWKQIYWSINKAFKNAKIFYEKVTNRKKVHNLLLETGHAWPVWNLLVAYFFFCW